MKGLLESTLKIIDDMFYQGKKITYNRVSKEADVSKGFLYSHKEIVEKITYYKTFNKLSIDDRILLVKSQNEELEKKITQYEDLLITLLEKQGSH